MTERKYCWDCKHFFVEGYEPGYSELTPADGFDFGCALSMWHTNEFKADEDTVVTVSDRKTIKQAFALAEHCKRFEKEKVNTDWHPSKHEDEDIVTVPPKWRHGSVFESRGYLRSLGRSRLIPLRYDVGHYRIEIADREIAQDQLREVLRRIRQRGDRELHPYDETGQPVDFMLDVGQGKKS